MAVLGMLDAPDDFLFLARHELYDYLNGKSSTALRKAKMAARKRVFHRRNERLEPTPTWTRNDVPIDLSITATSNEVLPQGTLVGITTSYGVVSGVSRIVSQLDQKGRSHRSPGRIQQAGGSGSRHPGARERWHQSR